jgi:hypothetical protein
MVDAANFYANKLMDGRLHRHVQVEIILDVNFQFAGLTTPDDDRSSPRFFSIQLNHGVGENLFQVLAHEMVHVMQYATGQLSPFCENDQIEWQGVPHAFYGNDDTEMWETYPWEIEAEDLEFDLYEEWKAGFIENYLNAAT